MKDKIFLPISRSTEKCESEVVSVPLETYISLFVLNYCHSVNVVEIVLVETDCKDDGLFMISRSSFGLLSSVMSLTREQLPKRIQECTLPALESCDKMTYVGGLCAVLRWAIKPVTQEESNHCSLILGFRGNCLTACSEVSLWTRFCESDLPGAVKTFLNLVSENKNMTGLLLPEALMKFEQHLALPVKTHNILKRKQDIVKTFKGSPNTNGDNSKNPSGDVEYLSNCVQKLNLENINKNCTDMNLEHIFAEGIDKTLADLILLPCVHVILTATEKLGNSVLQHVPHVYKWYERLLCDEHVQQSANICGWKNFTPVEEVQCTVECSTVPRESLYSRDPKRNKMKIRHHDPSPILEKLRNAEIQPQHSSHPCENGGIDWHSLPLSAHPAGGDLPLSRVDRKCQQVESIVTAVLNIAKDGNVVVDFCSGGGHIGILLAYYLPKCEVIMIENKAASLERARRRSEDLQLDNVTFYQCNLDYYEGSFDIAVALHACGVSTDLVIQKSLEQNASFVCCPCCYGYISNTLKIKYPKSRDFANAGILYQEYLKLCHCADRTEFGTKTENEGKLCMALVDTDRYLHARDNGYNAYLCTLIPPDCTPKSNLLIGIKEL